MEEENDKLQIEERYLDCPECYGNGVIFKDGPVESIGTYGKSPWRCFHIKCYRCDGIGHLGVKLSSLKEE